jgi:hypothetical protein
MERKMSVKKEKVKKDTIKEILEEIIQVKKELFLELHSLQTDRALLRKNQSNMAWELVSMREEIAQNLHLIKEEVGEMARCFIENKNQIESFEDALLHIMHNIKKNQFLYAHYPEEWVTDYISIKEGIKFENKFMEEKGAVNV